jgi:O-antigen ligase
MLDQQTGNRSSPAELWVLWGLLLVLPSWTAPKSALLILVAGYVALLKRKLLFSSLRSPDPIEWTLLGLILSSCLSSAWNWDQPKATKTAVEATSQALMFWYCYRVVSKPGHQWHGWFLCIGAVLGLAYGATRTEQGAVLSLYELGTGPRSAIYLGIALFCVIGLLAFEAKGWFARLFAGACVLALLLGLWVVASRAAILAVAVGFAVIVVKFRAWRMALGLLAATALTGYAAFSAPSYYSQHRLLFKFHQIARGEIPTADLARLELWRAAIQQVRSGENMMFGAGTREASTVLKSSFAPQAHAHNLLLFRLAEQGAVGLLAFTAFLGVIAWRLYGSSARSHWLEVAAAGAFIVPVLAGLVGSAWVKGHAMLAMIVLGLWAGNQRQISGEP